MRRHTVIISFVISAFIMIGSGLGLSTSTQAAGGTVERMLGVDHIYEKPTMEKISQLYWALKRLSLDDNDAVDNYMLINECDIYANFYDNEFEWQNIRKSGRNYLRENIDDFPVRFAIEQPIYFSEYDFERAVFEVWQPYRLDDTKLFEVRSSDYEEDICGVATKYIIEGYPRSIVMELSRPFTLVEVPMKEEMAQRFLTSKAGVAASFAHTNAKFGTRSNVYSRRAAFLVLKVKFSSVQGDQTQLRKTRKAARILSVLEEVEIYADREHKMLLYSKRFREREENVTAEQILKARVDARRIKRQAAEAAEKVKATARAKQPKIPAKK